MMWNGTGGGPLGGGRMQYQLRQAFVFLDAHQFNKPEIFVGLAHTKFDEKTMEFKDEAGIKCYVERDVVTVSHRGRWRVGQAG